MENIWQDLNFTSLDEIHNLSFLNFILECFVDILKTTDKDRNIFRILIHYYFIECSVQFAPNN